MTNFSSLCNGPAAGRGRWLAGLLGLVLLLLGRPETARATHIRAGEIQARVDTTAGAGFNPRRIFFRMTLYTDNTTVEKVVEDSVFIFFGDGSCTNPREVVRSNRYGNGLFGSGPFVRQTPLPGGNADSDVNYYYFEHIFPASGRSYTISYVGENRNRDVRNIDQSVNKTFYISTTITIDPSLGRNHSPVLNAPAVDKGAVFQVFLHNPGASDADGDSLAFHLRKSLATPRGAKDITNCEPDSQAVGGFRYPNNKTSSPSGKQVAYPGPPVGVPNGPPIFVQDPRTGQITWNSPGDAGIYNVAFVVEEWRRTPQGPRLIGQVIRDMQIIIKATTNLPPVIKIPNDTCVIAGATVVGKVSATDGSGPGAQDPTPMVLSAYSGILPPATFQQTQKGPPTALGRFEWKTECSNVASEPYQVLFKVQDSPPQSTPPAASDAPPLIDERVWRITVVGPPPQNLQAVPGPRTSGNTAQLTWNSYTCQSPAGTAADRQVRLLIFRKEGSATFNPGPCDTGIPAGLGYQQIGSVSADQRSFLDDKGLERGKTYCYRIYAVFPLPAGGESIASQEACLNFGGRAAVLTNVDVNQTSTTGQITVRWTRPVAPQGQPFAAPFSYRLSRGEGQTPAAYTVIAPAITNLADTVFVDRNIDTQNKQYTYKLEFLTKGTGTQPNVEASPTASSVRLSATAAGLTKTITVNWTYNVPWDNTQSPTRVYRRTGISGTYAQVGTVTSTATGGTYTDADPTLQLDQTYCYYVQTEGRYAGVAYLQSLLNKSQEFCVPLTSEPCAPVLTVRPINCDSLAALPLFPAPDQRYENRLRWTLGNTPAGCTNNNVAYFRIYSRFTEEGTLVLRDSTSSATVLSYVDRNLPNNAACYAVQAVDASGRRSPLSNIACVDNCLFFVLPNIFTPNADNINDTFRPKVSSPVRRVRFQAFNRWGVKVYESDKDPLINWDGGGARTEASGTGKVADGVYYYLAEVEFADFKSTKRTYKGWVQVVR